MFFANMEGKIIWISSHEQTLTQTFGSLWRGQFFLVLT